MSFQPINAAERERYQQIFQSLKPVNGLISGSQARPTFLQSGLGNLPLQQIWALADVNGDGYLSLDEFCIAMRLIYDVLNGAAVPRQLPPYLLQGITTGGAGAAGTRGAGAGPSATPAFVQQYGSSLGAQHTTASSPPMYGYAGRAQVPVQPYAPRGQVYAPSEPPSRKQSTAAAAAASLLQTYRDQSRQSHYPWKIPVADRFQYGSTFTALHPTSRGQVHVDHVRQHFELFGRPQSEFLTIWSLVDINDNQKYLEKEQFITFMHVLQNAQKGIQVPRALPSDVRRELESSSSSYRGVGLYSATTTTPGHPSSSSSSTVAAASVGSSTYRSANPILADRYLSKLAGRGRTSSPSTSHSSPPPPASPSLETLRAEESQLAHQLLHHPTPPTVDIRTELETKLLPLIDDLTQRFEETLEKATINAREPDGAGGGRLGGKVTSEMVKGLEEKVKYARLELRKEKSTLI